jgi:ElaB/YqjD/DUF883 family membrane-anchored ribosome-binding protein
MESTRQMKNDNLGKHRQAINDDLGTLADDARALVSATAEVAGEKVVAARQRLAAALDSGKELYGRAREKAVEGAQAADRAVRENPYKTMGIAFGVGALIGFLFARRD